LDVANVAVGGEEGLTIFCSKAQCWKSTEKALPPKVKKQKLLSVRQEQEGGVAELRRRQIPRPVVVLPQREL
jgi:hypothetical protein